MTDYLVAQLNIARVIAPLDDPAMQDFVGALEPINALADDSPGFVWRLRDDSGDATSINAFGDPSLLVNLSLWMSIESLRDFVYRTEHLDFLKAKKQWFKPLDTPHLVLWWVPEGNKPTVEAAKQRLESLIRHGPTQNAFTLSQRFEPQANHDG
jgi:hypothetical protein